VLVAAALVAISVSSGWILKSYLTTQRDPQLQSAFNFFKRIGRTAFAPGRVGQVTGHEPGGGRAGAGDPAQHPGGQPGFPNWPGSGQFQSVRR